jgi:hypothetical protein
MLRTQARTWGISAVVQLIDIDQDAELLARYGDKVPVIAIAGRDRLWGRINPVWLRRMLEGEAHRLRKQRAGKRSSADE